MRPPTGKHVDIRREETPQEKAHLDSSEVFSLAQDPNTSKEKLHDLLTYTLFKDRIVFFRQIPWRYYEINDGNGIPELRKRIWEGATLNPNLTSEDIYWIVEQIRNPRINVTEEGSLPGALPESDYNILSNILLHINTPDDIREQLKTMTIHGKLVLSQEGKELLDEWDEPNWHVAHWRKEVLLEDGQKSVWLDPKFDEKIQEEIRQKRIAAVHPNPSYGLPQAPISDS